MSNSFINLIPPIGASPQSALDIFKDRWVYKIPVEGCSSGKRLTFYHEPPAIKLLKKYYPNCIEFDVLELGAHEGEMTYHLDRAARAVYAIEGRPANFLKCLIVQNELDMRRTHFAVGDFQEYLIHGKKKWDLCLCAGVLYHSPDPFEMLKLLSRRCKRLILSTVIYDREAMEAADKRTQNDPYPTGWLKAIASEPARMTRGETQFDYWERHFNNTDEQIIAGQGASHSLVSNILNESDLRAILRYLNGREQHFERADDERSPHVHAIVEFDS